MISTSKPTKSSLRKKANMGEVSYIPPLRKLFFKRPHLSHDGEIHTGLKKDTAFPSSPGLEKCSITSEHVTTAIDFPTTLLFDKKRIITIKFMTSFPIRRDKVSVNLPQNQVLSMIFPQVRSLKGFCQSLQKLYIPFILCRIFMPIITLKLFFST